MLRLLGGLGLDLAIESEDETVPNLDGAADAVAHIWPCAYAADDDTADEGAKEYDEKKYLENLGPMSDYEVFGRQYVGGADDEDIFETARDSPWSSPERPVTKPNAQLFAQEVVKAFDTPYWQNYPTWDEASETESTGETVLTEPEIPNDEDYDDDNSDAACVSTNCNCLSK